MPVDFVGREVEVRLSEDDQASPVAFRLGDREYKIAEQITSWQDRAFGQQRGRDQRPQRQRQHYRVRTEDGDVYEIYADWSPARRRRQGAGHTVRWYLHRRISSATAPEAPAAAEAAEEGEGPSEDGPASG